MKTKNIKQLEKKYVDELKDEYDRLVEVRTTMLIMGCLVTVILALTLIAFKFGLYS